MNGGLTPDEVREFENSGFHFPLDALSAGDAHDARTACLKYLAVADRAGGALSMHRYYPKIHLLNNWAHELVRNESILDAVESLIGPDILVWSTQIFNNKAGSGRSLSWHQDAVYYGFNNFDGNAVRVWIALTHTSRENGTMSYSRGSHRAGIQEHGYRGDAVEVKLRGEEVLMDIDPETEVEVLLEPGQASMHNMLVAHSSGVNVSADDRLNFAVDFLSPEVEPVGLPDSALLVRGQDRNGHFQAERPPETDFGKEELAQFFSATTLRLKRMNQLLRGNRDETAEPAR